MSFGLCVNGTKVNHAVIAYSNEAKAITSHVMIPSYARARLEPSVIIRQGALLIFEEGSIQMITLQKPR